VFYNLASKTIKSIIQHGKIQNGRACDSLGKLGKIPLSIRVTRNYDQPATLEASGCTCTGINGDSHYLYRPALELSLFYPSMPLQVTPLQGLSPGVPGWN
jgi:hypothetical protein